MNVAVKNIEAKECEATEWGTPSKTCEVALAAPMTAASSGISSTSSKGGISSKSESPESSTPAGRINQW